jgi:predicted NAD-dependent protein-ADP-ribosyltransferase YbiA (DUF1768 family)
MTTIQFYEKSEPFYEFSNFYTDTKNKILIDEKLWINTEQYFQAMKFYNINSDSHMNYFDCIQSVDSPMKAMILGRQKQKGGYAGNWTINKKTDIRTLNEVIKIYSDITIRDDWNYVRDEIMEKALLAKFSQNEKLKTILINTKDNEIIEASPRDDYWGWGKDKTGKNMLGKLLMKIRSTL